jgi:NitT/TauT family transport system ATP-binding protein
MTVAEVATRTDPILSVRDLSVVYQRNGRRTVAVEGVNLDVQAGEFVCIVGASGCGKTTLLRAMSGLVKASSGEIRLHGQRTHGIDRRIAMVFQEDALFPWRTALQNARVGLEFRHGRRDRKRHNARAQECLDIVNLGTYESFYPHELSGGMRQRVNLSRALAVDPEILLMDEPFAALDAQTREAMQRELLRLWDQAVRKTILFITHQLDEAVYLADRVIVLSAHPGRVREVIEVEFPRPRDLSMKRSAEFGAYVERIWGLIEQEVYESLVEGTRVERG